MPKKKKACWLFTKNALSAKQQMIMVFLFGLGLGIAMHSMPPSWTLLRERAKSRVSLLMLNLN